MKTKMKQLISLLLVLVLVCSAMAGCGKKDEGGTNDTPVNNEQDNKGGNDSNASSKPSEIKIAMVGPMTGDNAQYGIQFKNGTTEAVEAYNARGGTQVTLDTFDDKNDAKEAVSIANKIIADGGYAAVIGPFSSTCALAMAEVLDEEKIISISPSCSHVDYVAKYDYTFRLSHVNASEGEAAAQYMKDTFGSQKVAGIYSNNDWGIGIDEGFVNKAKEIGLDVVANESFILGQTKDVSATITKIKQAGAESIFYMGQYTEAAMLMKQIKDMNLDVELLITTSSYKVDSLELAGDAAEGVTFMTAFFEDPDDQALTEFSKMAKEKYDVAIDSFILRSYDATMWLLEAFDKCESTDPDVLVKAIIEVGQAGVDALGGDFSVKEDRNIDRVFIYTKWNGKTGDEIGFEKITP